MFSFWQTAAPTPDSDAGVSLQPKDFVPSVSYNSMLTDRVTESHLAGMSTGTAEESVRDKVNTLDYTTRQIAYRQTSIDPTLDQYSAASGRYPRGRQKSHLVSVGGVLITSSRPVIGGRKSTVPHKGEASLLASTFNMSSACLGTGMLALSYVLSQTGIYLGVGLLVFFAMLNSFAMLRLADSLREVPIQFRNLGALSKRVTGYSEADKVTDLLVLVYCMGPCICTLIVVGDCLPNIARWASAGGHGRADSNFYDRNYWTLGWSIFLLFPLATLENMEPLKYTSMVSVMASAFIIVMEYAYLGGELDACGKTAESLCKGEVAYWLPEGSGLYEALEVLPIISMTYCVTFAVPVILDELADASVEREFALITMESILVSIFYIVSALGAYLTYGSRIQSNLLVSYPEDAMATVARIALVMVVSPSFPILMNSIRDSVLRLTFKMRYRDCSPIQKFVTLFVLMSIIVTIALLVDNLATVLAFAGAIGGVSLCFVLPTMYYAGIVKTGCYHWVSKVICGMGMILLPLCTVINIIESQDGGFDSDD